MHLRGLLLLLAAAGVLAGACDDGGRLIPGAPAATASPAAAATLAPPAATTTGIAPAPALSPAAAPPAPDPGPVASTAAIATEDLPRVRFVVATGMEAVLPVEVPPQEEYAIGLSGRRTFEGRGMLFYYPDGRHTGGFWMKGTLFDLDIAFVDADLRVIEVIRMTAESLEIHQPSQPYLAAIEAPAGWYAQRGIGPGARVQFLFDPREEMAR
jgi:uncharacterized membrane protein (UPF0127 family)